MFGVVPKPLWSKRIAPDDRNRIPLAMRCLLIEHPDGLVLIDTGLGNKEDAKFRDIYGISNAGPEGRTQLEAALAETGHPADDVKWVINTHLHFDHAGGNTWTDSEVGEDGKNRPSVLTVPTVRLTFPNATYHVQSGDLDFARHPNERTRASYLPHNFEPVAEAGRWRLLHGDVDVLPGISVRVTPGHVPYHQSVLVRSEGETLFYLADVMPTRHHLPLPWIMGYDLEPLRTLESKRKLVREAMDEGWWLFFEHDPDVVMGRLGEGEKGPELAAPVAAPRGARERGACEAQGPEDTVTNEQGGFMRAPLLLLGLGLLMTPPELDAQQTAKPPLHGRHWMAITGKPLGATAGAMIFQKGGNAVDAACAMLAAVTTMWDVLSWGGETQALIYHPGLKKVIGINALGVAPTGATAGLLQVQGDALPAGVRAARRGHARHARAA